MNLYGNVMDELYHREEFRTRMLLAWTFIPVREPFGDLTLVSPVGMNDEGVSGTDKTFCCELSTL